MKIGESRSAPTEAVGRSLDTASIVRLIEEKGTNVNQIARALHQHKESVRYRYRERILANKFKIQAKPNHERLGLKRLIVVGDLETEWWRDHQLFKLLNETAYFVSFSRTLPDSRFVANLSIPPQCIPEFETILSGLAARNVLRIRSVYTFDLFTNPPMLADYYDFDADRWDFDWQTTSAKGEELLTFSPSEVGKFDFVDLLLIKELQLDATRPLSKIAKLLDVDYKRAIRHFQHVVRGRLIHGYKVVWSQDATDLKRNTIRVARHKYLPLFILVKSPTQNEMKRLKLATEGLPFLSAEAVGEDFFAQLIIPFGQGIEALQYLQKLIEPIKERTDWGLIDPEFSVGYTISYQLYDEKTKEWVINARKVLKGVDNLMVSRAEVIR